MTAPSDAPLFAAYAALDSAGVRWVELRGDDPGGPSAEVDLLIAPADLGLAGAVLAVAGFVALATRGLGSHRFFVTYDVGIDRWVKLDVVTELAFGRRRELRAAEAEPVLDRRIPRAEGWALAPADAFWALALHCALDRHAVAPRHRARLAENAGAAGAGALAATIGDEALVARVIAAAASGDDTGLLACAGPLRRALTRSRPAAVTARLAGDAISRLGAKLTLPARPGLVVALLGPDGSGKSTLAAALRSVLPLRSRLVYGGLYARGQEGPVARLLHLGRFAFAARYEARRGGIVIADRHPLESAGRPGTRAALRRRLYRAAPPPDLALFLDCEGETMFVRKGEHSPHQLEAQRRRLLTLGAALPRSEVLDARLPRERVRAAASLALWGCLRDHA